MDQYISDKSNNTEKDQLTYLGRLRINRYERSVDERAILLYKPNGTKSYDRELQHKKRTICLIDSQSLGVVVAFSSCTGAR